MKISLELMKRFSDERQWLLPADELVAKIGSQLGAIEEVIDLASKYKGIRIVEITEAASHPNADKLNIYQMSDGTKQIQVVSGDTHLQPGDKVAWIAPGQTVPSTYGTSAPVIMEARDLRGETSHGMFGSGKELGLNDDHRRVQVLDTDASAGSLFAEAYNLNDTLIDIENKMFTHRPDCFGNIGVAREIAGIQGLPFLSPDWYAHDSVLPAPESQELKLHVKNDIPALVPRFIAVPLGNITVGPSPLWLQSFLQRLGIRPINNIVDITNYSMMVTGQPLHAYDYDKVKALNGGTHPTLTVRNPKKGETITLLNGKTIEPHTDAMMVAAGDTLVCVGGMIGGANSEVDARTSRIILEAATWDMFSIRRTSMHHGIFTDAVTRFSKGQSPLQNAAVITQAVRHLQHIAGARIMGEPVDNNHVHPDALARGNVAPPIVTTAGFINERLGTTYTAEYIATVLNNVECSVETHGDELMVTAPFWRTDIEIPEDIVEETGRLHGFETLPHELPRRSTRAVPPEPIDTLKSRIHNCLAAAGANELQTYSFVPTALLRAAGQSPDHAFVIRNALSPDLQQYRLSLTPSVLEKVHANIKAGFVRHALFEMNKIHIKGDLDCEGLPREYQTLAFVYAAYPAGSGAAYYQAKYYLEYMLRALHIPYHIVPPDQPPQWEIGRQVFAPFEPKRSAYVLIGEDREFGGFIGEYHAQVRNKLKLPDYAAGFEIDLERVLTHQQPHSYQKLLRFPATGQDVCLRVAADIAYGDLETKVSEAFRTDTRLRVTVAPLDIYQQTGDNNHKQITFHITLQHAERTLTTDETNSLIDAMCETVNAVIPVERI